MNNYRTT